MGDLTLQLLRVVEGLHAARVLHQDLQPSSLMRSESGQVYLVGFGRAKSIPIRKHPQDVHPFTGNYRFASVRGHNQQELSKKDDLEALFYVIAHLYYRKLPWSRLSLEVDHKLAKIKQLKINYRDILFAEMGMPFVRAFEYVTSLETYGEPDYA
jgi:serine/threonine protein kinase